MLGEWEGLATVGAIHRKTTENGSVTSEWYYFISSRKMGAAEMLQHARLEWSVETMHYLLDVHYKEYECRLKNRNCQKNLNMARKTALNLLNMHKEQQQSKVPLSRMMIRCLVDLEKLTDVLNIGII